MAMLGEDKATSDEINSLISYFIRTQGTFPRSRT